jgi:hypothetical protein
MSSGLNPHANRLLKAGARARKRSGNQMLRCETEHAADNLENELQH